MTRIEIEAVKDFTRILETRKNWNNNTKKKCSKELPRKTTVEIRLSEMEVNKEKAGSIAKYKHTTDQNYKSTVNAQHQIG